MLKMETNRLLFRERTRDLMAEVLTQSVAEQLLFLGLEKETELEYQLQKIKLTLANTSIDYCIFDLIEKNNKVVIGSCGFHNWKKGHARAEMGYGLHQNFRGKGYMTEAIQELITYGFSALHLNRIEALIAPNNIASIKIVVQNGFQQEGVLREHYQSKEGFEDSILYALLKSDFEKRKST